MSIQPQLALPHGSGPEALAFYAEAFGADVLHQVGGVPGDEPVVAQLAAGDTVFWLHDEAPAEGTLSPAAAGGCTVRLLLIADDPDSAAARAIGAGATETAAMADEHGWRLGRIVDPFGHHWEIGRPLGAWPPGS